MTDNTSHPYSSHMKLIVSFSKPIPFVTDNDNPAYCGPFKNSVSDTGHVILPDKSYEITGSIATTNTIQQVCLMLYYLK